MFFHIGMMFFLVVCFCHHSNSYKPWLFISSLREEESHNLGKYICDQLPLAQKQKKQCIGNPRSMASVREGVQLSKFECQHQFRGERWNCSTSERGQAVYGKIIDTREAAFVHAITSAAVAYAITVACSQSDLLVCSCDSKKRGYASDNRGNFSWGGCSDDINYGIKYAQTFLDAIESDQKDALALVNLHNNRAGRRAVKRFVVRKCRCHGPTSTCVVRTCWDMLDDFRKTGNYLKKRYDGAAHVSVRLGGRQADIRPAKSMQKRPTKNDLVYLETSPNYCFRNTAIGSLGTSGRECNLTSQRMDGCNLLCCGRGYDTMQVTTVEECRCKFHWCCEIECESCTRTYDVYTCKPEPERRPHLAEPTAPAPVKARGRNRKRKDRKRGKKRKRVRGGAVIGPVRSKRDALSSSSSSRDALLRRRRYSRLRNASAFGAVLG